MTRLQGFFFIIVLPIGLVLLLYAIGVLTGAPPIYN
jgi:hypothetical protein